MKKNIFPILAIFFLWAISYFFMNQLVDGKDYYNFQIVLDTLFPFLPFFVIFYLSAYALMFYPLFEGEKWEPFALGMLSILFLTNIIFFLFPGNMIRPSVTNTDIWATILSWIYTFDKPHNLFPSTHISLSFMSTLILHKKAAYIWFILIAFSTLFVKQHYILDILGGLVVGGIGYLIYKIEKEKTVIAKTLNAKPKEIIFTSGATESNTLAIRGILGVSRKKEILISAMEHASIKNLCHELQKEKYIVHKIPVNKKGEINLKVLKEKLTKDIALVSIIHANNETGVIQDIQKIADLCAQKNIPFHTDAVQSYKKIPLDLEKMKCTALSISAHKIHGPKAIAALYLREGTKIKALFYGGKQEQALRPGTENISYILAFAAAAQLPYPSKQIEQKKEYLIKKVQEISDIKINTPQKSIQNILNVSIRGIDAETLVKHLSNKGICISAGSACTSGAIEGSHVLKAMQLSEEEARASIRISLSKYTTKKEIDETIKHLKSIAHIIRKL